MIKVKYVDFTIKKIAKKGNSIRKTILKFVIPHLGNDFSHSG